MCARQSERARPGQGLIALATPLSRKVTMTSKTQKAITALDSMRLPELQARYLEVTGTTTRCPNRTYLIRKISEALTSNDAKASSSSNASAFPMLVLEQDTDDTADEVGVPERGELADADVADVHDGNTRAEDDAKVPPIGVPQEAQVGVKNRSIEVAATEQT